MKVHRVRRYVTFLSLSQTVLDSSMSRGFSFFSKPKPCWPEPDLSRGEELKLLRDRDGISKRCWNTLKSEGTAFAAFIKVRADILDCLESRPKLNKDGQTPSTGLTCCLVGTDPHTINPAIVIHCQDETYRKNAVKLIYRQLWWKVFETQHPSFILLQSPRAPTPATTPPRRISPTVSETKSEPGDPPTAPERILYAELYSFRRCGSGIEFSSHNPSRPLSDRAIATVGGYVTVDGDLVGLSVAHPLALSSSRERTIIVPKTPVHSGLSDWEIDTFDPISAVDDDSGTSDDEDDQHEVKKPGSVTGGMDTTSPHVLVIDKGTLQAILALPMSFRPKLLTHL